MKMWALTIVQWPIILKRVKVWIGLGVKFKARMLVFVSCRLEGIALELDRGMLYL
jgi:hypothetical protein